jgi:hypothetical protein
VVEPKPVRRAACSKWTCPAQAHSSQKSHEADRREKTAFASQKWLSTSVPKRFQMKFSGSFGITGKALSSKDPAAQTPNCRFPGSAQCGAPQADKSGNAPCSGKQRQNPVLPLPARSNHGQPAREKGAHHLPISFGRERF